MKKILQSKGTLAVLLAAACIIILGVCIYVNRSRENAFQPEESSSEAESATWEETSAPSAAVKETEPTASEPESTSAVPETDPPADYPKVSEENGQETEITFTPTEKPEETPPPAPEGKTVLEDPGPEHPVNPAPEVTAPAPVPESAAGPQPGETNADGAIYDPVFGWIVPSRVEQSVVDSDGDPNKMVGNMGN